ncbi:MAG: Card1-like endonuclease domain-containing protein [Anaerotignum sp.]
MEILIEFYDKDVLKNIVAPLTLRPKKVIFFYDRGMQDILAFTSIKKCLERNIPEIKVEQYPVDINAVDKIFHQIVRIFDANSYVKSAIDLTGGSELMILAGYKAGTSLELPLLHTDLINKKIIDIADNSLVANTVNLTLEDFVDAKGACLFGESHQPPSKERYDTIKEMARFLFERLFQWKYTCSFLQTVAAKTTPNELFIQSKWNIPMKNDRSVYPDRAILEKLEALGFIQNLSIRDNDDVQFHFSSIKDKQYCINYGVWLELYVYIAAKEAGVFHDVKLGTMIDWNAYDNAVIAGNEIDVLLMDGSIPVFISCKLKDADTAALNELLIARKRLGGWFSKGIMVTFSKDKNIHTGTYKRAHELGLELLDGTDVMADNFKERLAKSIQDHDLVGMKWIKV